MISSIIDDAKDVSLIEVKEKLLKEHESLEKKDTTMNRAFQVNGSAGKLKDGRANDRKRNAPRKNRGDFKGKCIGATLHMPLHRPDLFDYGTKDTSVEVTIADGKKLKVSWKRNSEAKRS
ncbi:unnamed protein product [Peronospora belbahrii]|uniref:Uncharacterized protein n=1 Tax=Peronospora belbahrii TaxID=622444 RepID=A0ABN8CQ86_9STRA|nr:unnamed protein product [Peronospora belbahrii]